MRRDVEIYMDYVILFGTRVERPSRVPRSEWEQFWRYATR